MANGLQDMVSGKRKTRRKVKEALRNLVAGLDRLAAGFQDALLPPPRPAPVTVRNGRKYRSNPRRGY